MNAPSLPHTPISGSFPPGLTQPPIAYLPQIGYKVCSLRKQLSVRQYVCLSVCYVFLLAADTKLFELQKHFRPFWNAETKAVQMVAIMLRSDPQPSKNDLFWIC